ncbi:MAG: aminotransferase class V-fold PLP-dependent enzyme [Puniceicoccales bacterium]|jgi:cysteine desulfurase|nr:aminotransferase class V-fold PLP-dependent enzyme [Puniceicoccales bacterium]
MHYFDANATSPLHPAAREAWLHAQDTLWQNPASLSSASVRARSILEECRVNLASRLGASARAKTAIFTSGATEGNNAVIAFESSRSPSGIAIVSAIEHPSLLAPAQFFFGRHLRILPVDASGTANLDALEQILTEVAAAKNTALVSLMAVNNETGVIQPIPAACALAERHGARIHCDATQAFGKIPPQPLAEMLARCDYVTGSAHKFGGPKGTGFLLFDAATNPHFCAQRGGGQENHHRAGTVNTPSVCAMLAALTASENSLTRHSSLCAQRDSFEKTAQLSLPGTLINGNAAPRIWNTSSLSLPRHTAIRWMKRLEKQGVIVSDGSACSSGDTSPSHVLRAMGIPTAAAQRTLRISAPPCLPNDWDALASALKIAAMELDADTQSHDNSAALSHVISVPPIP